MSPARQQGIHFVLSFLAIIAATTTGLGVHHRAMKSGILRGGLRLLCRPPQRMMCSLSPSSQQLATSIEDSVLKSLEALQVRPDSGILLCVSGGSDSMALLHIMQRIKERHWPMLQLKALTVNHLQRPEAFEEVEFVGKVGESIGLQVFKETVPERFATITSGFQEIARHYRRDLAQRIVSESFADKEAFVCLGHHSGDQAETVIMKILRGVHISNISGMSGRTSNRILRPLLHLSKEQLVSYLQARSLEWREDESNSSPKYKRNRVRNDLLPIMEELTGGKNSLSKRIAALVHQSEQIRQTLQYVKSNVSRQIFISPCWQGRRLSYQPDFLLAPSSVVMEILLEWITATTGKPTGYLKLNNLYELLTDARRGGFKKTVELGNGWDIDLFGHVLYCVRTKFPTSGEQRVTRFQTTLNSSNVDVEVHHPTELVLYNEEPRTSSAQGSDPVPAFPLIVFLPETAQSSSQVQLEIRKIQPKDRMGNRSLTEYLESKRLSATACQHALVLALHKSSTVLGVLQHHQNILASKKATLLCKLWVQDCSEGQEGTKKKVGGRSEDQTRTGQAKEVDQSSILQAIQAWANSPPQAQSHRRTGRHEGEAKKEEEAAEGQDTAASKQSLL